MKPSEFILNSDYLSIAQVDSKNYNVYVGGGSIAGFGYTEQNFDFATPAQTGAIDRILISKDNGDYMLGSYMSLVVNMDVTGFIQITRTSKTNLRAKFVLSNYNSGVSTYPAMSFKIKVSSFKPPNVF